MAKTDHFCNRAEAYEAHDNVPLSPADGDSIGDIILRPIAILAEASHPRPEANLNRACRSLGHRSEGRWVRRALETR